MWFKLRLALLVLALLGVIAFAWFTIQSEPKRRAAGEFTGLLFMTGVIVLLALLIAVTFRREPKIKE